MEELYNSCNKQIILMVKDCKNNAKPVNWLTKYPSYTYIYIYIYIYSEKGNLYFLVVKKNMSSYKFMLQ